MKQFLHDHQLENVTVPTVQLSQHQMHLRRVLVSRATQRVAHQISKEPFRFRGVIHRMNTRIILASTGTACALAVAVITFSAAGPSQNASALARSSSQALSRLPLSGEDTAHMSPAEITYTKYYPQFANWLNQAQHAKDLRVLTYEQLVQAYPQAAQPDAAASEPLRVINNPSDGQTPDVHSLKYLIFTLASNGGESKIVVGINSHNIPEAALVHIVKVSNARG